MADSENRKLIGIVVECAKMTPEIFEKAIEDMLKNIADKNPQGKTSLDKLMKTGKVENIAVSDSNIGSFAKTARKYNLTYALKRTQTEGGKKQYLVCFHDKNLDTMQRAFKEYSYNQTHQKETFLSKKKVSEIQVSAPEQENDRSRQREKEHKKQRPDKNISL